MKKYEKEVVQAQLDNEKAVLKKLEANYRDSLEEINSKIAELMGRADADMSHVIYQVEYQKALKAQVQSILQTLQTNEFTTVSEYLTKCYDEGFLGTMYELQSQGVPLAFPINQEEVVAAIQHETKLSDTLYKSFDTKELQKKIASEISRGFSTSATFAEISRNVAAYANISKNNAKRIVRTEGHRITETAAHHVQEKAVDRGADLVKIWDASLDAKTRDSHVKVDGEIREVRKRFSNGLMFPGDSAGKASEVINCRCRSRTDARWALDAEQTKMLGDTSEMSPEQRKTIAKKLGIPEENLDLYSGEIVPLNAKNYADFKQQYNKYWHYKGSALQKEAEARIAGYGKTTETEFLRNNMPKGYKDTRNVGKPISKQELDGLKDYAQSYGVQIGYDGNPTGGFDTYCGDVGVMKEIIRATSAQLDSPLFKKSKATGVILKYDNVLGYRNDRSTVDINAFASCKGKTITLNKFMFDDSDYLKKEYANAVAGGMFPKGTDYTNVAVHEAGHIIEKNTPGLRQRIVSILEDEAANQGISVDDYIMGNISIYAVDLNSDGVYHELVPEINSLLKSDEKSDIIRLLRKEGVIP